MPFLNHWPESANVFDIFRADVDTYHPFCVFTEELMRGRSSLNPDQKELIAAYVSGVNSCEFCYGAHSAAAEAFGFKHELFDQLMSDVDAADIDEKMKPLLRLAKKITHEHNHLGQADVDAIFEAGWDEKAYRDTVAISAFFNMMNRLVHGFGIQGIDPELRTKVGEGNKKFGYLKRFEMAMDTHGYPGADE